jgi:predicted AAA+ superfamily ATPase
MYIKRTIEEKLLLLLSHFPSVAVLGPRQVGKTTLVNEIRKKLDKESIYLDLENPADLGALGHPVEFLNSIAHKTVIIDEIQRMPDLFPVLRSVIDNNRISGRFILLGSATPQLLFLSNETLAGRIAYLELDPFDHTEIQHLTDFRNHWLRGGFPTPFLLSDVQIRKAWFRSFLSGYLERDLRMLGLNTSPAILQRLFQMISAHQGGLLNMSNLANSLGISVPTVQNAISFFERSFIVRLLQPWYSNIGKRLVKTPKIYVRDSGIINHLLDLSNYEDLLRHPLLGSLWEGYVVEDLINTLGDGYSFFFYRTADGAECDLVVVKANVCIATIDAKFTPNPKPTKSMAITIQDLRPQKAFFAVPECAVPYPISDQQSVATPWQLTQMIKSMQILPSTI